VSLRLVHPLIICIPIVVTANQPNSYTLIINDEVAVKDTDWNVRSNMMTSSQLLGPQNGVGNAIHHLIIHLDESASSSDDLWFQLAFEHSGFRYDNAYQSRAIPYGCSATQLAAELQLLLIIPDYLNTCGRLSPPQSICAPSVIVTENKRYHDNFDASWYTIELVGEYHGQAGFQLGRLVMTSASEKISSTIHSNPHALMYYNMDKLWLTTGIANDTININSMVDDITFMIDTNNGDDAVFISSLAMVPMSQRLTAPQLNGTLLNILSVIQLNLGAGDHRVMVSEDSIATSLSLHSDHIEYNHGGERIEWTTANDGHITYGLTLFLSSFDDTLMIHNLPVGSSQSPPQWTAIYTGEGNDRVDMSSSNKGRLAIHLGNDDDTFIQHQPSSVVVIGGYGSDTITTLAGSDIVIGDDGSVITDGESEQDSNVEWRFGQAQNGFVDIITNSVLVKFNASSTGSIIFGNGDTISTGDGIDYIIGGINGDNIVSGQLLSFNDGMRDAVDFVIADLGWINVQPSSLPLMHIRLQSTQVDSSEHSEDGSEYGGNDSIESSNSGMIIAGGGADIIKARHDNPDRHGYVTIIGDDGIIDLTIDLVTYLVDGIRVASLQNQAPLSFSCNDQITATGVTVYVIGGSGVDNFDISGHASVIIGDDGDINFSSIGPAGTEIISSFLYLNGDKDTIQSTSLSSTIIGGIGDDTITAYATIIGDAANVTQYYDDILHRDQVITANIQSVFYETNSIGNDAIVCYAATSIIIGGDGSDEIEASSSNSMVFGDSINATITMSLPQLAIESSSICQDDSCIAQVNSDDVIRFVSSSNQYLTPVLTTQRSALSVTNIHCEATAKSYLTLCNIIDKFLVVDHRYDLPLLSTSIAAVIIAGSGHDEIRSEYELQILLLADQGTIKAQLTDLVGSETMIHSDVSLGHDGNDTIHFVGNGIIIGGGHMDDIHVSAPHGSFVGVCGDTCDGMFITALDLLVPLSSWFGLFCFDS
jgi:hypothetical protein